MSNKLKPCPFCGGEAKIYRGAFESYRAECKKCGVATMLCLDAPKNSGELEAIEIWNKRTPLIDCESAEKCQGACVGYQKSECDDEPIEQCMHCDKYWGREMFIDED